MEGILAEQRRTIRIAVAWNEAGRAFAEVANPYGGDMDSSFEESSVRSVRQWAGGLAVESAIVEVDVILPQVTKTVVRGRVVS